MKKFQSNLLIGTISTITLLSSVTSVSANTISDNDSWTYESSHNMVASTTLYGAEYKGTQLGTPDLDIYIKGCAYIHARAGSGSDKRINMAYVHNPNKSNFSFSISAWGIGISYSPSNNIYDKTGLFTLDY